MEIIELIKGEIQDHFGPKLGEDEEIQVYFRSPGEVAVEFSVPWFGFIIRLITRIIGSTLELALIDVDGWHFVYRRDLQHPQAIEGLLEAIGHEWDKYLGRAK